MMKDKGSGRRKNRRTPVVAFLLLCAMAARPLSAALSISAETDKTTLAVNDSLYLTVTVGGDSASVPEPEMPGMDGFNVYSAGRSQNISFVNGKVTSNVAFTYILSPRFIGRIKIPPISITDGAQKRSTPEMEITVVKSDASQSQGAQSRPRRVRAGEGNRPGAEGGSSLFMTAETDRRAAYPNEQVNLTIRFYTSVPLTSNPQYVPPQFKNLTSEDLPPVRNGDAEIKGTRYSYSEIRVALFGIQEGQASVGPASVMAQVYNSSGIDPFDPNFFQQFFAMSAGQGETKKVASPPVALKVLPFPEGAPDSFKGAAGDFTMAAALSSREVKAGEAVNLSLTVSGRGNLRAVAAPTLP
ncbi:MAG TPA: BatD family protein, partial [Elusimicrobiales bacterium]|nr:BatD family protein [Elusimicrobiales bacterium]